MSEKKILLGFEVGTGKPVHLRLHHLVITGMTQLSGKTTTLEALIQRSGLKAIAFITKRGEIGFQQYHEVLPYFKERSDWQYVESLIEATLRENQRFNRSWIIKASRGAKTLKDVLRNVEQRKEKARKDSLAESVYTNLAEYLKLVIPQIERFQFSDRVELQDGINVMNLSEMSLEMRNLVIRSVMEYALDKLSKTIIIVPEAWEYLPQYRSTPVKYFAEAFIRKGASVGNYLWVDSQDIAGIDKTPLRQCDNWILGRQKDVREVKRTREEIFKNTPTEREIMTLKVGYFYACIGNDVHLVYVQPSWLSEQVAKNVALGKIPVEDVYQGFLASKAMEKASDKMLWKHRFELEEKKRKELETKLERTRKFYLKVEEERTELQQQLDKLTAIGLTVKEQKTLIENLELELRDLRPLKQLRDALIKILPTVPSGPSEPLKTTVDLEHTEMVVNVTHKQQLVKLTTEIQQGQIMYVAINDLPKEGFTEKDISEALKEHGWNIPHTSLAPQLSSNLAKQGLLIKIQGTRPQRYRLPTKLKIKVSQSEGAS